MDHTWSNYTHEDYLILFLLCGESDEVISRRCDTCATRLPAKQKPSPNTIKKIIKNSKNFGLVRTRVQKKASNIPGNTIR